MLKERRGIKGGNMLLAGFLTTALTFPVAVMAVEKEGATPTLVEDSQPLSPNPDGSLSTIAYASTPQEQPFFDKLAPQEQRPGDWGGGYAITGKNGVLVGWFGIVRKIEEDKNAAQTTLLVENKYFDGLTDSHLMAVSFNGGGDFVAILDGVGLGIKRLNLVRVYGSVTGESNATPEVKANYVRQWDWGTFTFIEAYGKQQGNTEWQKLNKVAREDIYDEKPSRTYYEDRLGPRQE